MYTNIQKLIDPAQHIAVFGHTHPDGDSIGSSMGIGLLLEQMGKQVTYILPDEPASIFNFLPEITKYTTTFDYGKYDLLIFLDIADTTRIKHIRRDRPEYFHQQTILNIDHHISNPGFGTLNIIDPTASSTCELLTEIFQEIYPQYMDSLIATYLLMGISTDTGNFIYEQDPARTFSNTLTLLSLGADKERIIKHIYRTTSLASIKFKAKIIERITLNNKLLTSRYTDSEVQDQQLDQEGIAERFLITFTSIQHDGIYVFFKIMTQDEQPHLRCSLRSNSDDYDVSALASQFGGGGHKRAAGCKIHLNPGDHLIQIEHLIKKMNERIENNLN